MSGIKALNWKKIIIRNSFFYLILIETIILQLLISIVFFLISIIKFFDNIILISINKFTLRLSIKWILHLNKVWTSFPILFFSGKYKKRAANFSDLCFNTLIFLTFSEIDIVLIFCLEKCLESRFLSKKVILYSISKQAIDFKSEFWNS